MDAAQSGNMQPLVELAMHLAAQAPQLEQQNEVRTFHIICLLLACVNSYYTSGHLLCRC